MIASAHLAPIRLGGTALPRIGALRATAAYTDSAGDEVSPGTEAT
jgi:hypothetical protein